MRGVCVFISRVRRACGGKNAAKALVYGTQLSRSKSPSASRATQTSDDTIRALPTNLTSPSTEKMQRNK
jgi:hypothetical protein